MFTAIANILQTYWIIPIVIALLIFGLFWLFCKNYWRPAKSLSKEIQEKIKEIYKIKSSQEYEEPNYQQALGALFKDSSFYHAWAMYQNTLHDEWSSIDGEDCLIRSKATASSEYFFSQSLLIDTPLNIEFFKHLPSLMTGIGIIGTFAGLLMGLLQFDPSGNPANVQDSLDLLLHGVSEAFVASGFAILMAMVVTWKEKAWLRTCYADLEKLTTAIDNVFDADDVGEIYLTKLVKSAEDSANQAKQLKDSLVDDLKVMIANLAAENHKSQIEMASHIGQSIADSLQSPLDKIASSVQQVSGDQGSAVQDLLTDVLTAFMNRLETTFGTQMTGMGEMMSQSVNSMREMQQGFGQLISDLRNTSEASSKALEQQIFEMLTGIEQRQKEMSNNLTSMLDQVDQSVSKIGDTGASAAQQMGLQVADMLRHMNEKIEGMVAGITEKRIEQDRVISENQQALHQTTTGLLDNLTAQITRLLEESQIAIQSSRQNIEKLTQVSTSSITGMNDGAEKMRMAAERFTTAGQSLGNITEQSSALLSQVNTVSGNLANTTNQLRTLVTDYQHSRDSINQAIQTLEKTIEVAQREAGMSSQMLADMQSMTQSLDHVRQDMQDYLNQVNDVLVKGFDSFSAAVESTLTRTLSSFDNNLEQAVNRLASGVEGLSTVTEDLEDIIQRNRKY